MAHHVPSGDVDEELPCDHAGGIIRRIQIEMAGRRSVEDGETFCELCLCQLVMLQCFGFGQLDSGNTVLRRHEAFERATLRG